VAMASFRMSYGFVLRDLLYDVNGYSFMALLARPYMSLVLWDGSTNGMLVTRSDVSCMSLRVQAVTLLLNALLSPCFLGVRHLIDQVIFDSFSVRPWRHGSPLLDCRA